MIKKSNLFVLAQLLCMGMLFIIYGIYTHSYWIVLQMAAVGLAIWAIAQFRWENLSPFPEPKKKAILISGGPYALIRNPMYLSLLLYFLAFLLDDFNWFGLNFYLLLMVTLLIKLNFEEAMLKIKFPAYSGYCKQTHKLIPYIY